MLGGLVLSLAVGALSALGALVWSGAGGRFDLAEALGSGVYFCLVAAAQEAVFRGWVLISLTRRLGFWGAAMITSLAFSAIHAFIPGQNGMGLVGMGLFGMAMCAAVRRFGALWWAVGFHAGWDVMLTAIFGFGAAGGVGGGGRVMWRVSPQAPVWLSGGPAGPEASVVTLAMLGLLLWALAWRSQRSR